MAVPVLVKDGKPCASSLDDVSDHTNGGLGSTGGLLDHGSNGLGHHGSGAGVGHPHHHHGGHMPSTAHVKSEYAAAVAAAAAAHHAVAGDTDVCGSEMAAAMGMGAAAGGPLPTLMHMGYGGHRHSMFNPAATAQDSSQGCMSSYFQHRSAW